MDRRFATRQVAIGAMLAALVSGCALFQSTLAADQIALAASDTTITTSVNTVVTLAQDGVITPDQFEKILDFLKAASTTQDEAWYLAKEGRNDESQDQYALVMKILQSAMSVAPEYADAVRKATGQ